MIKELIANRMGYTCSIRTKFYSSEEFTWIVTMKAKVSTKLEASPFSNGMSKMIGKT
jgi:hypothetical protein